MMKNFIPRAQPEASIDTSQTVFCPSGKLIFFSTTEKRYANQ